MVRRLLTKLVRVAAVAVLVGTAVLAAPSAQAQFGMGMEAGMMDQSVSRRSLEAMAKILGLDKDQKEAAINLLEGYKTDQKAVQDKMQADMKAIQEKVADTQDFTLFQKEMPKLAKEAAAKGRVLETTFFNDFKSTLNEGQLAKWPKVEQYRRRDKFMKFAIVSGSAVDLLKVIERVKATPANNTEFASTQERYEASMDAHLVEMEKAQKEMEEKLLGGNENLFDFTKIQQTMKEAFKPAVEIGKAIRETNKEYTRKLGMLMDDESRVRFENEVKARTFPRVYREVHVVKQMDEAIKMADLDKGKKEEITNMRATYLREVVAANEKWAKAIEERDDKGGGTIGVMMSSMMGGASADLNKDVNAARQARKEIDGKVKDRLDAMLTDDQKQKLPAPPPENRNPWADMMPEAEPDDAGGK